MKILDRLPSIFSAAQRQELEKLLYKDIRDKKIVWRDVLTKAFDDRIVDLYQPYNISRIPGYNKVIPDQIVRKLEDIIVALLSLISESNQIGGLIGKHEMFEKDIVKIYTDISTQFLNMVDNTVKNYKLNMIEVRDGVISMVPNVIQHYFPVNITTTFFPENVIKVSGNEPTSENIFPGTESGYWITSILSKVKCDAGAVLAFDFGGIISFNNIIINSAGKYAMSINKMEIPKTGDPTDWEVVSSSDYQVLTDEKKIVLTVISDPIAATKVRLTLTQPKYDFIWSKTVDNTETYLENILDPDEDVLLDEKTKLINQVLLKDNFSRIIEETKYSNIYEYILGSYNIAFLLKTYDGQNPGIFLSKKYVTNNSINTVKIVTEEYKPSSFTIQYDIVQSDGSLIENVTANEAVSLTKEFDKSDVFSGLSGNVVTLSNYPIANSISSVKIDGKTYDPIDKFSQTTIYEYIVKKNKIFVNRDLAGSIVNVEYKHHTEYVVIQITMKTNTTYSLSLTPKVTSFDVKLNKI